MTEPSNDKVSAALVLTLCCPHCLQESKFHVEPLRMPHDASGPSYGGFPPPTPEKPPINESGATVPDFKSKLWTVLEALNAREGESDRQLVTDFLRAAKAIREEQEPENWPIRWLPYRKPSHLRDLGLALARFRGGEPAQFPYPPNDGSGSATTTAPRGAQPISGQAARPAPPAQWANVPVPYGPIKGTALGQLPPDVQFDLWNTFQCSMVKDAHGHPVELPTDRKFRNALNDMGKEKNFVKA